MKRKTTLFLALISGFLSDVALADGLIPMGNRAFGANRRVQTEPRGYTAITGTFSEPDVVIGSNGKPTFYLGSASGGNRVDAGIQYERESGPYPEGWSSFMDASFQGNLTAPGDDSHPGWTNPRIQGKAWRIPLGSLRQAAMGYKILPNGAAQISITPGLPLLPISYFSDPAGYGTNPVPAFPNTGTGANQRVTVDTVRNMSVRRIVAVTQGGEENRTFELDGTSSINNFFSAASLGFARISNGRLVIQNDEIALTRSASWTNVDHEIRTVNRIRVGSTGFNPGGRNRDGQLIFQFDWSGLTDQIRNQGGGYEYRDRTDAARYSGEAVHINLGRASQVAGRIRPFRLNGGNR